MSSDDGAQGMEESNQEPEHTERKKRATGFRGTFEFGVMHGFKTRHHRPMSETKKLRLRPDCHVPSMWSADDDELLRGAVMARVAAGRPFRAWKEYSVLVFHRRWTPNQVMVRWDRVLAPYRSSPGKWRSSDALMLVMAVRDNWDTVENRVKSWNLVVVSMQMARNATACRAKWAAIVKYIKAHILPGIETVTPTIVMALIDDSRGKSVPFLA